VKLPSTRTTVAILSGLVAGVALTALVQYAIDRPASSLRPDARVQAETRTVRDIFQRDTHDSEWAPVAREAFIRDLSARAQAGSYELIDVECRRISCAAQLRWVKESSPRTLLSAKYEIDCIREVLLPPSDELDGAGVAYVYFDCSATRKDAQ
jgi:hypothetical protein